MKLTGFILCIFSLAFAPMAIAESGEELHAAECTQCHGSSVYTRPDRKVKNMSQLNAQIMRCSTMLNKQWFDEDVQAVADYLNKTYYRF